MTFNCLWHRAGQVGKSIPASLLFVGDGLCQYSGSGIAVAALLPVMPGYGAAWWRVTVAAILLLAWRRPWRKPLTKSQILASSLVGLAITLMNLCFYQSLARIDMGTAVSVEFIGPVLLAVLTGTGWKPRVGAFLAFAGVVSIGGIGLDFTNPSQLLGFLWALAAGLMWVGYIAGGTRIAQARSGIDSLAIGLAAGALLTAPFNLGSIKTGLSSVDLLVAVLLVGLLSSAIPFSLEQVLMSRLGPDLYSLLSAIMPATSALVGAVMLRQIPSFGEFLGLILISLAVALVNLRRRKPEWRAKP